MAAKDQIGDFSPGGKRIAIPARDADGKIIPGVEWVDVNPLEAEIYGIRKGGYSQVPNQSVVKDPGTEYPYKWQSEIGIVEVETGNTVTVLGQSLYTVFMDDIFDDSPMAGFVSLPVVSGALTEVAMWVSEQSYDIDGNVMPTRPHQHFRIEAGAVAGTRFEFSFRPTLDSFVWDVTGEPLNLTKDNGKPVEKSFPDAGVFYRGESALFRRIQYERHDRGSQKGHLLRFTFWQGWTGAPVLLAYFPARLAESKTPAFYIASDAVGGFDNDRDLTGGYHVSQVLVATETPREAPMGTTDEIAEGNHAPISSHGVALLQKVVTSNYQDNRDAITLRVQAAAAAQRYDAFLGLWLSGLTDPKGDGVYAKMEDVPEDRRIALVKTASGLIIHYRQEPVAPATVGALVPLNTYQGAADAVTAAYSEAITFVSGLRAAAGSPVSSAELAEIRADIDNVESELVTLAKTVGREVAGLYNHEGIEPTWPTGLGRSADGSPMVRKGQVTNVKTTPPLTNNGFAGSHYYVVSFGQAERGKAASARKAVKQSDAGSRIEMTLQTAASAGGVMVAQASLAYVDGAWKATGGTVSLDEGWAVLNFPFTFPTNSNADILCAVTPGDVQLLAIYDPATPYNRTPIGLRFTALDTGLSRDFLDSTPLQRVQHEIPTTWTAATVGPGQAYTGASAFTTRNLPVTIGNGHHLHYTSVDVTGLVSRLIVRFKIGAVVPGFILPMEVVVSGNVVMRVNNVIPAGATAGMEFEVDRKLDPVRNGCIIRFTRAADQQSQGGTVQIISIGAFNVTVASDTMAPIDVTGLATTAQLSTEIARAKKAEGDNALAITTNSASIGVVSSNLAAEVARAKAAEAALSGARPGASAKKQGRVKLWSPEAADFIVTLGSLIEDTTPAFAGSSDIEAKTFTVVPAAPGARPATVKFTATGLVVGQRYELVVEVGSGLNTGFALAGSGTATEDVTNWRKHRQIITATATTYAGSYTVTHGAVVHGPAVYALPGLYVQDEALNSYQVAEPADVAAAEARANAVTNLLAQTVQGQGLRISALEAGGSGASAPDLRWFPAEREYDKTYTRRTKSGAQAQSISFDFIAAGSGNVPVSINLPTNGAPISGWPISQFWGVPTLFINTTPPGGSAMTVVVCASVDGVVEIGVGPATGNASSAIGRVRSVLIDGIAADKTP